MRLVGGSIRLGIGGRGVFHSHGNSVTAVVPAGAAPIKLVVVKGALVGVVAAGSVGLALETVGGRSDHEVGGVPRVFMHANLLDPRSLIDVERRGEANVDRGVAADLTTGGALRHGRRDGGIFGPVDLDRHALRPANGRGEAGKKKEKGREREPPKE